MKRLILIFLIKILLVTEGVTAQNQNGFSEISPVDSVLIQEDEYDEAAADTTPYINPYQEATNKYFRDSINRHDFNENSWKKAKEGIDFTLEPEKKDTTSRKNTQTPRISPQAAEAILVFFKWFFVIGAIVILAYLVLRFVGEGNIFSRQSRKIYAPSVKIDLENIEENLEHTNIDPYIQQAINNKQFSLAVRLYYLAVLKELTLKEAIKWKKDKTNRAYISEMRQHRLSQPFRDVTHVFERVWYGDSVLNENDFYKIEPNFKDLLKNIKV